MLNGKCTYKLYTYAFLCALQRESICQLTKHNTLKVPIWNYLQKRNTEGIFDVWKSKCIMNEIVLVSHWVSALHILLELPFNRGIICDPVL